MARALVRSFAASLGTVHAVSCAHSPGAGHAAGEASGSGTRALPAFPFPLPRDLSPRCCVWVAKCSRGQGAAANDAEFLVVVVAEEDGARSELRDGAASVVCCGLHVPHAVTAFVGHVGPWNVWDATNLWRSHAASVAGQCGGPQEFATGDAERRWVWRSGRGSWDVWGAVVGVSGWVTHDAEPISIVRMLDAGATLSSSHGEEALLCVPVSLAHLLLSLCPGTVCHVSGLRRGRLSAVNRGTDSSPGAGAGAVAGVVTTVALVAVEASRVRTASSPPVSRPCIAAAETVATATSGAATAASVSSSTSSSAAGRASASAVSAWHALDGGSVLHPGAISAARAPSWRPTALSQRAVSDSRGPTLSMHAVVMQMLSRTTALLQPIDAPTSPLVQLGGSPLVHPLPLVVRGARACGVGAQFAQDGDVLLLCNVRAVYSRFGQLVLLLAPPQASLHRVGLCATAPGALLAARATAARFWAVDASDVGPARRAEQETGVDVAIALAVDSGTAQHWHAATAGGSPLGARPSPSCVCTHSLVRHVSRAHARAKLEALPVVLGRTAPRRLVAPQLCAGSGSCVSSAVGAHSRPVGTSTDIGVCSDGLRLEESTASVQQWLINASSASQACKCGSPMEVAAPPEPSSDSVGPLLLPPMPTVAWPTLGALRAALRWHLRSRGPRKRRRPDLRPQESGAPLRFPVAHCAGRGDARGSVLSTLHAVRVDRSIDRRSDASLATCAVSHDALPLVLRRHLHNRFCADCGLASSSAEGVRPQRAACTVEELVACGEAGTGCVGGSTELVGVLSSCPLTGRLQLVDATGCIELTMLPAPLSASLESLYGRCVRVQRFTVLCSLLEPRSAAGNTGAKGEVEAGAGEGPRTSRAPVAVLRLRIVAPTDSIQPVARARFVPVANLWSPGLPALRITAVFPPVVKTADHTWRLPMRIAALPAEPGSPQPLTIEWLPSGPDAALPALCSVLVPGFTVGEMAGALGGSGAAPLLQGAPHSRPALGTVLRSVMDTSSEPARQGESALPEFEAVVLSVETCVNKVPAGAEECRAVFQEYEELCGSGDPSTGIVVCLGDARLVQQQQITPDNARVLFHELAPAGPTGRTRLFLFDYVRVATQGLVPGCLVAVRGAKTRLRSGPSGTRLFVNADLATELQLLGFVDHCIGRRPALVAPPDHRSTARRYAAAWLAVQRLARAGVALSAEARRALTVSRVMESTPLSRLRFTDACCEAGISVSVTRVAWVSVSWRCRRCFSTVQRGFERPATSLWARSSMTQTDAPPMLTTAQLRVLLATQGLPGRAGGADEGSASDRPRRERFRCPKGCPVDGDEEGAGGEGTGSRIADDGDGGDDDEAAAAMALEEAPGFDAAAAAIEIIERCLARDELRSGVFPSVEACLSVEDGTAEARLFLRGNDVWQVLHGTASEHAALLLASSFDAFSLSPEMDAETLQEVLRSAAVATAAHVARAAVRSGGARGESVLLATSRAVLDAGLWVLAAMSELQGLGRLVCRARLAPLRVNDAGELRRVRVEHHEFYTEVLPPLCLKVCDSSIVPFSVEGAVEAMLGMAAKGRRS